MNAQQLFRRAMFTVSILGFILLRDAHTSLALSLLFAIHEVDNYRAAPERGDK